MIELAGEKTRIRLSATLWTMTLELARLCGWEPQGTMREPVNANGLDGILDGKDLVPWHADYLSADGQTVTANDATLLGNALSNACENAASILDDWQAGRVKPPVVLRTPATGFAWFTTPEGKEHLRNIAAICRRGKFKIQ